MWDTIFTAIVCLFVLSIVVTMKIWLRVVEKDWDKITALARYELLKLHNL